MTIEQKKDALHHAASDGLSSVYKFSNEKSRE